ncbi:MAG: hypothetical protein RLZZ393_1842 [Pseudomonadota bacterium]
MPRKPASLSAAVALAAAFAAPAAHAEWALNMTRGVTDISRDVYSLHMTILWWCTAIAVFVFGWMIVSLVKFRKSKGAVPDTAMVHSTKAEIIWTIIPVAILVVLAVPSARTLIAIEDASKTQLTVKVTAYQWKWQYDYLDKGVSFFSTLKRDSDAARQMNSGVDVNKIDNYLLDVDNPLVVPVGTKVRALITAQDVIHAWWVPAFAVKKDAIPGFVNEVWFQVDADKPGIYRGQCTELCGRDHGFMPIVVVAKPKDEYEAWLKAKQDEQKQASLPAAPTAG